MDLEAAVRLPDDPRNIVEGIVEYLLARTAQRTRPWLERAGSGFNRCCGGLFAAMGLALPLTR